MKKNLLMMFLLITTSASFLKARGTTKLKTTKTTKIEDTTHTPIQKSVEQPTKNPGLFRATTNSFSEYAKVKTNSIVNTTKESATKLKNTVTRRAQSSWEKFKNLFRAQPMKEKNTK